MEESTASIKVRSAVLDSTLLL